MNDWFKIIQQWLVELRVSEFEIYMFYIKIGYIDNGSEWEVGYRWFLEGVCCCFVFDICFVFFQIFDFGLFKWMEQLIQKQYIERLVLRGIFSYIFFEMFLENNKVSGFEYDVYR